MKNRQENGKTIDILSIIRNGGATLDKNGDAVQFSRGYQVSLKDCFTLSAENLGAVVKAIKSVLNRIQHESGKFCGVWIDSGLVYIDISENIKSREKALHVGKARHQISVYGWAESVCFNC